MGKCVWLITLAATMSALAAQENFRSPEEAAGALLGAFELNDFQHFVSVAGSRMAAFWTSGDPDRDAMERDLFLGAARKCGIRIDAGAAGRAMLYVGDLAEPFPAPLVRGDDGWRFDDDAGAAELTARRIRRNETAIMELCRRFREAEFVFRQLGHEQSQAFAQKIRSTPGQHDGLVWLERGEEDESPLGPLFAAAAFEDRGPGGEQRPLFGYYFRILTAQGPDAPGGALDYRVNGTLRKGFALVAWPAEYGVSGQHTFLINHLGDMYRKDLASDTGRLAEEMTVFNPDRSWTRFEGWE